MSEKKQWWYVSDEQEIGPCSGEEIRELIGKGEIIFKTKIRLGKGEWTEAGISALKDSFPSTKKDSPLEDKNDEGLDLVDEEDEEEELLDSLLDDEDEDDSTLDDALGGLSDAKDFAKSASGKFSLAKIAGIIILLGGILYLFFGDSTEVDFIKDSYLEDLEETTIGNAFDTFFDNPTWESFETENSTRIVEFVGYTKEDSYLLPTIMYVPAGSKFTAQFTLLAGDDFELSHMESPLSIVKKSETLDDAQLGLLKMGFELKEIICDGETIIQYSDEFIDGGLGMIYSNNWTQNRKE